MSHHSELIATDIDAYLALGLSRISWLVKQRTDDIKPGDRVYLWRAGGSSKAVAGIVALATVLSVPESRLDDAEARPLWRGDEDENP